MTTHSGPVVAQRDELQVIECRACGYAHLDPLPTAEELARYYTDEFWQKDKADWLARYEAQRDWDEMRAGDWLSVAEGLTAGRTLMDLGCGYGQFIETAGKRGWLAGGFETNSAAVDYCRQRRLIVSECDWSDVEQTGDHWDCISALWFLEHLPDPAWCLSAVRGALNPGGVLILAVPNEFTWAQTEANHSAAVHDWFVHKTHCNYFTAASIANLLGRTGWRIVDMLGTYPIEQHIGAGQDYTANPAVGDLVHAEIRAREFRLSRDERLRIGRAYARCDTGRDLIIFAEAE